MTTTASLTDRLSDTKNGLAEIAPAHLFSVFSDEQARLDRTTDRTRHVSVGDTVPPFSLPTADGTTVDLDAVLAGGPAVLVFYRGAWCPYCNVALRAYRDEVLPQLTEQGVTLVAISPQGPEGSLTTAKEWWWILNLVNRPNVGILWNVANAASVGFVASSRTRRSFDASTLPSFFCASAATASAFLESESIARISFAAASNTESDAFCAARTLILQ